MIQSKSWFIGIDLLAFIDNCKLHHDTDTDSIQDSVQIWISDLQIWTHSFATTNLNDLKQVLTVFDITLRLRAPFRYLLTGSVTVCLPVLSLRRCGWWWRGKSKLQLVPTTTAMLDSFVNSCVYGNGDVSEAGRTFVSKFYSFLTKAF